jgi:hypothetical protein
VTARILGFYNQSLLSSRSLVRVQQGAFHSRAELIHSARGSMLRAARSCSSNCFS